MHSVGAGLRCDVDYRSRVPPELRRVCGGLDFEFLNKVDRWPICINADDWVDIVHPIEQKAAAHFRLAGDAEQSTVGIQRSFGRLDSSGHELDQLFKLPAVERQFDNLRVVDHESYGTVLGLDQRSFAGNLHVFGNLTDLKSEVQP